ARCKLGDENRARSRAAPRGRGPAVGTSATNPPRPGHGPKARRPQLNATKPLEVSGLLEARGKPSESWNRPRPWTSDASATLPDVSRIFEGSRPARVQRLAKLFRHRHRPRA